MPSLTLRAGGTSAHKAILVEGFPRGSSVMVVLLFLQDTGKQERGLLRMLELSESKSEGAKFSMPA